MIRLPKKPASPRPRIRARACPGGNLRQADAEERDGAGRRDRVPGPQAAVPELLAVCLETEQRVVGAAAPLLGVVAHPGPLGMPVDHEDHRVEVEGQAAPRLRTREEGLPALVVQAHQLPDVAGAQPAEEPPQGGLIGEVRQPDHALEGAIVLEDLGGIDAVEPHDDGVEECHDELGGLVVAAAERGPETPLQAPLQTELLTERMDQGHPGEVRQVWLLEGDRQISQAFCHVTQSYPRGRILSKAKTAFATASRGLEMRFVDSIYASVRFIRVRSLSGRRAAILV